EGTSTLPNPTRSRKRGGVTCLHALLWAASDDFLLLLRAIRRAEPGGADRERSGCFRDRGGARSGGLSPKRPGSVASGREPSPPLHHASSGFLPCHARRLDSP